MSVMMGSPGLTMSLLVPLEHVWNCDVPKESAVPVPLPSCPGKGGRIVEVGVTEGVLVLWAAFKVLSAPEVQLLLSELSGTCPSALFMSPPPEAPLPGFPVPRTGCIPRICAVGRSLTPGRPRPVSCQWTVQEALEWTTRATPGKTVIVLLSAGYRNRSSDSPGRATPSRASRAARLLS